MTPQKNREVIGQKVCSGFEKFGLAQIGEDMTAITSLDKGHRTGPDPDTFDYIPA